VAKVILFEHENQGGRSQKIKIPDNVKQLDDGLRGEVTDVRVEGNPVWTILYEKPKFRGLGFVVNFAGGGPNVLGLHHVGFNDTAQSVRTLTTPKKWRDIVIMADIVADTDRRYDLRATAPAMWVADKVKQNLVMGNRRECSWEKLEIDLKKPSLEARLHIRHHHHPGGPIGKIDAYSVTLLLEFIVDLRKPERTDVKVSTMILGRKVTITAREVISYLITAGVI
jgi:hypothetical protein